MGAIVVGLILAVAAIAPTPAAALVTQPPIVVTPGSSPASITSAAKSVITNPTFITENLGESRLAAQALTTTAGATEAGGAVTLLQAAGAIPLGALAFGAGVGIGTAFCNLSGIFGSCLFEEVTEQNIETSPGWSWTLPSASTQPLKVTYNGFTATMPLGSYVASPTATIVWGTSGCEHPVYNKAPTAAAARLFDNGLDTGACVAELGKPMHKTAAASYWANKKIGSGTGGHGESSGTYKYGGSTHSTPNPSWESALADVMTDPEKYNVDPEVAKKVGLHVAHEIDPDYKHPYHDYVHIPNCDGLITAACTDLIEELGLEPQLDELDWNGAHVDKPAGTVVQTQPAKGNEVEVPSKVIVTTNPDEAGMPILIPQPNPGETYDDYVARLNPQLTPERNDLEAPYVDVGDGPDVVQQTAPKPETRLDPSKDHTVRVDTNPSDVPVPAGGGWSPPPIPDIDMDPLLSTGLGCTVFPFGLPCYIYDVIDSFNVSPQCPTWDLPLYDGNEMTLDGCVLDPVLNIWRPVFLFIASIGIVIFFAGMAGMGGTRSDDD